MKFLITGGSGMVGAYFVEKLSKEHQVIGLYYTNPITLLGGRHVKVDITDKDEVLELSTFKPDVIIHCAAITNISFCEKNKDRATIVNVEGTKNIADLARKSNSVLVYISTDAVFNGEKGNYSEHEIPCPNTFYGKTKLAGEKISLHYDNSIVIRTNVFGDDHGKKEHNFATAILKSLAQGKQYSAFTDAVFCPIYVGNLLEEILKLIGRKERGVFHLVGFPVTKYIFAKTAAEVFEYDTNLIQEASIQSLPKEIKYPATLSLIDTKLSLIDTKMNGKFSDSIPSLKDMLTRFKKDLECD